MLSRRVDKGWLGERHTECNGFGAIRRIRNGHRTSRFRWPLSWWRYLEPVPDLFFVRSGFP